MNNLFISGMARSGTTLLDKLLTNHDNITVLSQPLPLLFVDVKTKFLNSIGLEKYYVLNDEYDQANYSRQDFLKFLSKLNYSKNEVEKLFDLMDNYNGQYTKRDNKEIFLNNRVFSEFEDLYKSCLLFFNIEINKKYVGVKEPLCEEFIPYFCKKGFKSIIIIRDPRDVLASANYPKNVKHFGSKKPTLFLLRSWRKSFEFIQYLRGNKNIHFLKYEDLVNQPYMQLNKITDFLNLNKFPINYFENGIKDQNDKLWSANTSFDETTSFISKKSVGSYKSVLTKKEIAYTEAICFNEMKWLGYSFENESLDKIKIINNFSDYGVEEHVHLMKDFSSQKINVKLEISRLRNSREYERQ